MPRAAFTTAYGASAGTRPGFVLRYSSLCFTRMRSLANVAPRRRQRPSHDHRDAPGLNSSGGVAACVDVDRLPLSTTSKSTPSAVLVDRALDHGALEAEALGAAAALTSRRPRRRCRSTSWRSSRPLNSRNATATSTTESTTVLRRASTPADVPAAARGSQVHGLSSSGSSRLRAPAAPHDSCSAYAEPARRPRPSRRRCSRRRSSGGRAGRGNRALGADGPR